MAVTINHFLFYRVPVITEETARTALLDYVEDQFCWGKGTAKKLQFTNLQSSTSYHVSKVSFEIFLFYAEV